MTKSARRRTSAILLLSATALLAACTTPHPYGSHVTGPYLGTGGGYSPG